MGLVKLLLVGYGAWYRGSRGYSVDLLSQLSIQVPCSFTALVDTFLPRVYAKWVKGCQAVGAH